MNLKIIAHEFRDKWICWEPLCSRVEKILNLAKEHSARFTFFVTTEHVKKNNGYILERIADAGHEIASHSHNHLNFYDISAIDARRQIDKSVRILSRFYDVKGFRAPYLKSNVNVERACIDCGLKYSSSDPGSKLSFERGLWSAPVTQPMDYEVIQLEKITTTQDIGERWVGFVGRGQVLLFHPWRLGSEKYIGFLDQMLLKKVEFRTMCDYLRNESACCITFDLDFLEQKQVYLHTLKHLFRSPHFRHNRRQDVG